jgi:hypothetical protein
MTDPIRAALEVAAEEVLKNLKDRRGIRQAIEQCDADVQAEIGRTLAAKAIAAFNRTFAQFTTDEEYFSQLHEIAESVLAAAKEEPSSIA